jgi:hypothetical protein
VVAPGVAAAGSVGQLLATGAALFVVVGVQATGEVGSILTAQDVAPTDAGGPKKTFIKRGKRYLIFATRQDAADYLAAEEAAEKAIADAQRTSRRARKRLRERVYQALPIPQEVDAGALQALLTRLDMVIDLAPLIAEQNIDELVRLSLMAQALQEEEDIEMLLLM